MSRASRWEVRLWGPAVCPSSTRWLAFLTSVVLTAVLASPAAGQQPPESGTAFYAGHFGVSLAEAKRRLDLQPRIGALEAVLASAEPATFAGLWIQHEPSFRVVTRWVGDGNAALARDLNAFSDLVGLVDVRSARYSLAQLEADQATLLPFGNRFRFASMVNVFENRVEIWPTAETDRAELASLPLAASVWVDPQNSGGGPTVNIYGGLHMDGANESCTTGFTVYDIDLGVYATTTAGHCDPTGMGVNGIPTPLLTRHWYYNDDSAAYSIPGQTPQNWVKDNGGTHAITSRTFRANQPLNQIVCKYGRTTLYGCGQLTSKTVAPWWVPNASATFMLVQPTVQFQDLSQPGDSGGPVYLNSSAWGLISGQACTSLLCLVYTAIDYVEAGLGVRVKT